MRKKCAVATTEKTMAEIRQYFLTFIVRYLTPGNSVAFLVVCPSQQSMQSVLRA